MDNLTIEQKIALKKELLEGLNNLHNKILTSQEPLGEEFEKVLYDNLWDLYIRNDE